jgi:hypothetical protein
MSLITERFGLPIDLAFHENDLHDDTYEELQKYADKKAKQFYSNPAQRRGRSLETIRFNIWSGVVAEKFLIQEFAFDDDTSNVLKDLLKNKKSLEIKTFANEKSRQQIINHMTYNRKTKYEHMLMFHRIGKEYKIAYYLQWDASVRKYIEIESYGEYA